MDSQDRQSFKSFPGSRINVTDTGISNPISAAALRMSLNARGFAKADERSEPERQMPNVVAEGVEDSKFLKHYEHIELRRKSGSESSRRSEIRSAEFTELTSAELAPFKERLFAVLQERAGIRKQMNEAKTSQSRLSAMIWERENRPMAEKPVGGVSDLWKSATAESARVSEYEDLLLKTKIDAASASEVKDANLYENMCHSFASMVSNSVIWDTTAARSSARKLKVGLVDARDIDRTKVKFNEDKFEAIECPWEVPHMQNSNGGDIYVYPGFILYHVDDEKFSIISLGKIRIEIHEIMFAEDGEIPANTITAGFLQRRQVDYENPNPDETSSWDRGEMPVCRYASLRFFSNGGLNEEYLVSNFSIAQIFCEDFEALLASCANK